MRSKPTRAAIAPLLPLLVALASGCGSTTAGQALTPELAGNDPDSELDFWHTLPERRVTSNDEAFHAMLLLFEGADPAPDYAGRVAALRDRGMLPGGFDAPAEAAVARGTVAVALVKALGIKGGATMRLFGPSPRYATRELQFMGLYPPSSPQQTFSGPEFLGIIGRADDYRRLRRRADPSAEGATGAGPRAHGPDEATGTGGDRGGDRGGATGAGDDQSRQDLPERGQPDMNPAGQDPTTTNP